MTSKLCYFDAYNVFLYCRLQKKRNMSISSKNWKKSATPSSPNCTRVLEACQVECQVDSLEPVVLPLVVDPLVQLLKKLIKDKIAMIKTHPVDPSRPDLYAVTYYYFNSYFLS